jgi:hypothetical protein
MWTRGDKNLVHIYIKTHCLESNPSPQTYRTIHRSHLHCESELMFGAITFWRSGFNFPAVMNLSISICFRKCNSSIARFTFVFSLRVIKTLREQIWLVYVTRILLRKWNFTRTKSVTESLQRENWCIHWSYAHVASDWPIARFLCSYEIRDVRVCVWPPLWSSGQSSWLQIWRPGFDSRHYEKKK